MKLLVTGGAGFIGSHYVRLVLDRRRDDSVLVLDKLTYAGNLRNLDDVRDNPRFTFVQGDILNAGLVSDVMSGVDAVLNFAAETHVDRSLLDPQSFIDTDVKGTGTLLEAARSAGVKRYLQVSTDEVYGSTNEGRFLEADRLAPRSPYSASKAGAEMLVMAYHETYGLDTVVTRGSNTYGPYQFPEKLIPLFVTNALDNRPLPLYGDGGNVRDWIHVSDHCRGIDTVLRHGASGEIYNVGGGNERSNLELTNAILRLTGGNPASVRFVADRPGHDRRYAVDTKKIETLGWKPEVALEAGLAETVEWYRARRDWWEPLKSGTYGAYYESVYAERLKSVAV